VPRSRPDPDDPWPFILALYAKPGVQQACLSLQDKAGADVLLVLLSAWLWTRADVVKPSGWRKLVSLSAHVQGELLGPLRAARRGLKAKPFLADQDPVLRPIRTRIKGIELELEREFLGRYTALALSQRGKAMAPPATGFADAYARASGLTLPKRTLAPFIKALSAR